MIQYCGRTEVGRRRARNEDSILVGGGLLVVCDGMGGHQAGDVASRIGVDTIGAFISRSEADPELTWPYGFDPSVSVDANRVRTAIKLANRAIYTRAAAEDEDAGMGTTVLAAQEPRSTSGHVGHSRTYLIRGRNMVQLTRDDSLANSAWADADAAVGTVMKNVLTKALGVRPEVDFDVAAQDLVAGDVVLLCSDGLTNMLDDQAILEILARDDDHL